MEAKDVLFSFMENCQNRSEYFQYNLASNAVLDWFGRTIKGSECIERFLRCDVWPQYEQNFVAAVTCGPIETRSTHEQAKETPIENAILCTSSQTDVPSASGYESPPPSKRNLEKPPPLHRNKKYKRRVIQYNTASSGSDDEYESVPKSYNLRRLAGDRSQRQRNTNVIKTDLKSTQNVSRMQRKRLIEPSKPVEDEVEVEEDRSLSPMKRSKKMLGGIDDVPHPSTSTMNCSLNQQDMSKPFSQLKYLESIGSIRTIRRAKHPGINKVPNTKAITATPFVSPESQNGWDRKTKLKISYRTGLVKKNDIQFALIIYEPLTMITRRNLLEEFQKAAIEEEQQKNKVTPKALFSSPLQTIHTPNESIILKTPTIRNKPKNDKVSSLRRLRF